MCCMYVHVCESVTVVVNQKCIGTMKLEKYDTISMQACVWRGGVCTS